MSALVLNPHAVHDAVSVRGRILMLQIERQQLRKPGGYQFRRRTAPDADLPHMKLFLHVCSNRDDARASVAGRDAAHGGRLLARE